MIDRFDSSAPAYDAIEREKAHLRGLLETERRKTIVFDSKCNKFAEHNMQLIRQHEQDLADITSTKLENYRLRNRCTILDAKILELETQLLYATAERR